MLCAGWRKILRVRAAGGRAASGAFGVSLFTELSGCAEKLLPVLCARMEASPEIQAQIREIASRRLDWEYLLDEATENSVLPLLDRQLNAAAGDALPAPVRESLTAARRANTVRCLFLSAELVKVLDAFRLAGITSAIPYKGPALAVQAYGDVTLRDFDDLDIILPQAEMPRADQAMRTLGYRPRFDWMLSGRVSGWMAPGEYKYVDQTRRTIVELHTELTLRHFPQRPRLDELAARRVTIALPGGEVPTFGVEDGLTLLCVHGSKDFWERIGWVTDIAEMVRRHAGLDWDAARRVAEGFGAGRMLDLGLLVAMDALDAPVPREMLRRARQDAEVTRIATEIEHRLLNRDEPPMDARTRLVFRRAMVRGWASGWRYATRLTLLPAEEDLNMVRLPATLAPLYVALRPLRLLKKYQDPARTPSETGAHIQEKGR